MRTNAFHSQGDTKARARTRLFMPLVYAAIALFATSFCYGASLRKVAGTPGESAFDSSINQNFENIRNEFGDAVHITSTETIVGYKYFTNPVDFGTVTADSGTITVLNATTGTINNIVSSSIGTNQIAYNNGTKLVGNAALTFNGTGVLATSATITTLDSPAVRYSRPNLVWISTNAVDMSTNTGTTNQRCILFGDGNYRCVTENSATADKYTRFLASATANFTSGTEDSGLRSTYVRTANTTYSLWAVKSLINSANFVIVGDTLAAIVSNISALNTAYGVNSYVYLGLVRNGDNDGATTSLLKFYKAGNVTWFSNTATSHAAGLAGTGIRLANTAGATTLTYTYVSGSGAAEIQGNVTFGNFALHFGSITNKFAKDSAGAFTRGVFGNSGAVVGIHNIEIPVADGVQLSNGPGSSIAYDIYLTGFTDGALTDGAGLF